MRTGPRINIHTDIPSLSSARTTHGPPRSQQHTRGTAVIILVNLVLICLLLRTVLTGSGLGLTPIAFGIMSLVGFSTTFRRKTPLPRSVRRHRLAWSIAGMLALYLIAFVTNLSRIDI
jgi:hypothetical protein